MKPVSLAPSSDWQTPAATWAEIVNRYVTFIQVPAWRVTVKGDGSEKPGCRSPEDAQQISALMLRTVDRSFPHHQTRPVTLRALARVARRQGRDVPRDRRCPTAVGSHLQRALLLNFAGYTCAYCGRTAWGVYAERVRKEPPRTLRFELDHRITRRRLANPEAFDAKNLVVACRSCNTIKGEMEVGRFFCELESLAAAVMSRHS